MTDAELKSGKALVAFDDQANPQPWARLLHVTPHRIYVMKFPRRGDDSVADWYVPAPQALTALQILGEMRERDLQIMDYRGPARWYWTDKDLANMKARVECDGEDEVDKGLGTRGDRRNIDLWVAERDRAWSSIGQLFLAHSIGEVLELGLYRSWPSKQAKSLGVDPRYVVRACRMYMLSLGQHGALMPAFDQRGAPGVEKYSAVPTGRLTEEERSDGSRVMKIYSDVSGASVWPKVPCDATFISEFLASARYAAVPLSDHASKYLDVPTFQGNTFALGAGEFARRAFESQINPEQIVRRRTPFTFFASFLNADDEAAWMSALVTGDQSAARKFSPATKTGRLVSPTYRICPECLIQDRSEFNVGHWHVMHQMPALKRCPWHQLALHDQCGDCGAPLGGPRLRRLPGDHCGRCNSTRTTSSQPHSFSSGYEQFEALVVRAEAGQAPEIRPTARMRLMDRIIFRRLGEHGVHDAVRPFLTAWGAGSPNDLERSLRVPLRRVATRLPVALGIPRQESS